MGLPNYSTEGIVKANLHLARRLSLQLSKEQSRSVENVNKSSFKTSGIVINMINEPAGEGCEYGTKKENIQGSP